MTEPTFKRLRARRLGVIRHASLWDAGEYLLSVSGTSFSERYRRFYYRDIQAIVVQKGPRMGSLGALVALAILAASLGALAAVPGMARWGDWLWVAPTVGFVLLIYLAVAQSCRVFVYTAVSSEELPAIFRRSAAKRVLPEILQKLESAQGSFQAAASAGQQQVDANRSVAPATEQELASVSRSSLVIVLLFCLTLLASAAFAFWYSDTVLTPNSLMVAKVMFSALNALGIGSGVFALLKLFRIRLMTGLRVCVFSGLALLGLRAYALYISLVTLGVQHGVLTETMASIHWRRGLGTADCALSVIIGVAGLIFLTFAWRQEPQDPVSGGSLSML